jgi:uncharacterized protein YfaS (alpha-2-macroglobulin family)
MKSVTVNRPIIYGVLAGLSAGLLFVAGLLFGGQAPVPAPQLPIDVGGSERYLTHISTDKPIYRTGEKLYVRGVVLRADGHIPTIPQTRTYIEIKGPKGDLVASGSSTIVDSVMGFSWNIRQASWGEYTVRFLESLHRRCSCRTQVRHPRYRAPRLKSQIVFVRDGYGPGDTVAPICSSRSCGRAHSRWGRCSVTARVDGQETWKGETTIDASGNASTSFKLPRDCSR